MSNIKIRQEMLTNNIKSYELATAIGVNPSTLSVWLRTELTDERRQKIEAAIEKLSVRKEAK